MCDLKSLASKLWNVKCSLWCVVRWLLWYSIGSYSESIVGSKFHEVFIFMVSAIAYS